VRLHFRLNAKHRGWEEPLLAAYGEAVKSLRAERLSILGLLTYESYPGSQADWIENSRERDGGSGDNPYIRSLMESAFRPLLARFPEVGAWEIWNEPNNWTTSSPDVTGKLPGGFYVYPSNFAWILRRAYEEARSAGRRVKIVSGGLLGADFTGQHDSDVAAPYLRATLKMGKECAGWDEIRKRYGTWPADHWGLHLYISDSSRVKPDYFAAFPLAFARAVEEIEGASTRKQVWITEIGYRTNPGGLTEMDQAASTETVLKILRDQPRIGVVTWFKLHDEPGADLYFGLRRHDGAPKISWYVFRDMQFRKIAPRVRGRTRILSGAWAGAVIVTRDHEIGGRARMEHSGDWASRHWSPIVVSVPVRVRSPSAGRPAAERQ
jgi:hypothetical protein